jgi:hypothetical protein
MREIGARMSVRRNVERGAVVLAASVLLSGGLAVTNAGAAMAIGGNCSSNEENVSLTGPDGTRVAAKCASLEGDTKARGILDLTFAVDLKTSWFTAINSVRRSGYDRGPVNGTRVELARV